MIAAATFSVLPVVWLVGRKLIAERETACDQAVLLTARADDYVEGILNVCKFYCSPSHSQAAGISSADLKSASES